MSVYKNLIKYRVTKWHSHAYMYKGTNFMFLLQYMRKGDSRMRESRKRKALEEMDVMDDFMITELASHPTEGKKFARTLLSVLLQRKIGDITVHAQSVFQGDTPELRGIRLDVEITQHSIIENVKDEATQSIHDSVEKIKHSAEVRGKYMTIEEIIQKLMNMCGISREEAIEYVEGQA